MVISSISFNIYTDSPQQCTVFSDIYPLGSLSNRPVFMKQFAAQAVADGGSLAFDTDETTGDTTITENIPGVQGQSILEAFTDVNGAVAPKADNAITIGNSLIGGDLDGDGNVIFKNVSFLLPKTNATFADDWNLNSMFAINDVEDLVIDADGENWKVAYSSITVSPGLTGALYYTQV